MTAAACSQSQNEQQVVMLFAMYTIEINVSAALPSTIAETAVFSFYTWLIFQALHIYLRNGVRSTSQILIASACIVMYAMAASHWGVNLRWLLNSNSSWKIAQHALISCLVGGQQDACDIVELLAGTIEPRPCYPSIFLAVSITIGDAVVAWRACTVFGRWSRIIKLYFCMIIAATLLSLFLSLAMNTCSTHLTVLSNQNISYLVALGAQFSDPYGIVAVLLSWLTNICATVLIGLQAWQHRQLISRDIRQGSSGMRAEKILLMFAESGLLYCFLWSMIVAFAAIDLYFLSGAAVGPNGLSAAAIALMPVSSQFEALKESALIHLIGVYPTGMIVLVASMKSFWERSRALSSIPTPRIQTQQNIRAQGQRIVSTARITSDVDVSLGPQTQSISVVLTSQQDGTGSPAEQDTAGPLVTADSYKTDPEYKGDRAAPPGLAF